MHLSPDGRWCFAGHAGTNLLISCTKFSQFSKDLNKNCLLWSLLIWNNTAQSCPSLPTSILPFNANTLGSEKESLRFVLLKTRKRSKKYGRISSKASESFAVALAQSFSTTMLFNTTGNRNVSVLSVLVMRLNAYFITETYLNKSTMHFSKHVIKPYHHSTLLGGRRTN